VPALWEAREAQDAKKLRNAVRQQNPRSTASSSTTTPVTPPRHSQKKVHISRKVTINLISPEISTLEDEWDTAAENSPGKEEKEEDYIDIEDTLTSLSPVNCRKTRGDLKNKPPVVSRSGGVIGVVDEDKI